MDFIEFKAGTDDQDRRIDKVVKKLIPDQPLSAVYKAMRKGLIKCNGTKAKPELLLKKDDIIKIAAFLLSPDVQEKDKINKNSSPLQLPPVILQTPHLLFLNKPYGTLVQKAKKQDFSLDDCVKQFYKETAAAENLAFTPGPLHRLDKNTTGLITFSWSLQGARWFTQNIQSHSVQKIYLGIVQGNLEKEEIWEDNILKDFSADKKFQTVKVSKEKENNAFTIATPVKQGEYKGKPITLVQFDIKTGKTHQIRSQAASHGFPLLGDTAYNGEKQNLSREYYLHAYILNIPEDNPLNLPPQIICPLQKDMEDFITKTCY